MSFHATVYELVIASPSDVIEERDAVENVILRWNLDNSDHYKIVFLPVRWESGTSPDLNGRPQEIINDQIIRKSDMLIGIFWTRLGKDTGKAASGTIEEIQEMIGAKRRVMLYFSQKPADTTSIDPEQFAAVKRYQKEAEVQGLYDTFFNIEDLEKKLRRHLDKVVRGLTGYTDTSASSQEMENKTTLSEKKKKINALELAINNISTIKYQFEIERDSEPMNEDHGKTLLRKAKNILMSLHDFPPIGHQIAQDFRELLVEFRKMDEFGIYADGGESWREFWETGVRLIDAAAATLKELKKIVR